MSEARTSSVRSLWPDAEGWELCAETAEGRIVDEVLANSLAELDVDLCVLPAETLTVCPLWFRCADDSLLEAAIRLQLEKRNLLPSISEGQLIDFRIVVREDTRVLVLVMVLSVEKLKSVGIEKIKAERFSISPLLYVLPENSMLVWRELGRTVVAFTQGEQLAHFQALLSADDRSLALELSCLAMRLEAEKIITRLEGIVLSDIKGVDLDQVADFLETHIGIRAKQVTALTPKSDVPSLALLTPFEAGRRRLSLDHGRRWKIAGGVALVYFVLLIFLAAQSVMTQRAVAKSRERQEFLADKVADIRKTKERWLQIQGAVDQDEYPLEILALCVEAIPSDGVELSEFAINSSGKIVIAGRADSVPQALAFKSKLTSQQNLSRYDWNFPQPHTSKKGGGAVFKASGARNDYVTN